jgi:hypothetical protein
MQDAGKFWYFYSLRFGTQWQSSFGGSLTRSGPASAPLAELGIGSCT